MASVDCPEFGADVETTDDVETESVAELAVEDDESSGPPRITLGANKRNVFRCKGCGKVLGVN